QIVRYVRLSTLFLYLANRAFIPSLMNLRQMDDLEGRLALELSVSEFKEHFDSHVLPFAQIKLPPPWITGELREHINFSERCEWWFNELAKRRAIWCWNLFDGPSNAMWHLYGSRGVLIHSTIGRVKNAFKNSVRFRGLISPVRYRPAAQLTDAARGFDPTRRETWPPWYMRPYLFKQPNYRYEQELRFVFGIHPSLQDGISIEIDGRTLIEGISVSPDIPKDEGALLI